MAATSLGHHRQFDALKLGSESSFTNFPDTFKDFFSKISDCEDNDEVIVAMLEDKLIPRTNFNNNNNTGNNNNVEQRFNRKQPVRRSHRRSFHRRASDYRSNTRVVVKEEVPPVSPAVVRRRSSSIAVARTPPDLNRFLQAEQQKPWGHLSPGPSSPSVSPNSSTRPVSPRGRLTPTLGHSGGYRNRTASMPAVPRQRPMLGQLRAQTPLDDCNDYYRVRSFSITPNGIFNLGDSFKSRRSRSITSVESNGSSQSELSLIGRTDRHNSNASQTPSIADSENESSVPVFKVAMLGSSGVGKTTLTHQFTTSEYICAYDTSLDEEFGQKTVSVMLDGQEAELEIVDHPASEMSVESYCTTYNPDVFVVVYSVVDRKSLKYAEDILLFLWKSDYITNRGVILVGNKADLERKREVPMGVGRKIANNCGCKFIETSSGLDHNVDELLVGILAQVKLNESRNRDKVSKHKKKNKVRIGSGKLLRHLLGIKRKAKSCENLLIL